MALKLIRRGAEIQTSNPLNGTGLSTATGAWGTYFKAPADGVAVISVTGDVEQICVWVRDFEGVNIQTYRARRGTEFLEQCALHAAVPLAKGQPWFVQAEGKDKTVTIMHDFKPIPPPYLVASLRAWWGGCRGAEAHQSGEYPDGGVGHAYGERVGGAHRRFRLADAAKQAVSSGLGSPRARCRNVPAPRLRVGRLEDRHSYPSLEDRPRVRGRYKRVGILAGTGCEVHAGALAALTPQGVA